MKRAKYATLTTATVKEEIEPVLIHDPNAEGGAQYTYATFSTADEAQAAVASLAQRQHHIDGISQEIIIDENGRAVTIQQLVEHNDVEEVEATEEIDGTHTILHTVPSSSPGEIGGGENGGEGEGDLNVSPSELMGSRSKTFKCTNCGHCTLAVGSLKLHMRACMGKRKEVPAEQRTCKVCNTVYSTVKYLKEHMARHTCEVPKRCARCFRKYFDEERYKRHMDTHKQQDKLDAEAAALAEEHGGKKVVLKEFTCSFCSQQFTVVFEAGQEKRRYACDECRDKYSNAVLKQRKQTVDDKRKLHCERCGRKFAFEGYLQRHIPSCDGTIKWDKNSKAEVLKQHKQMVDDEREFHCERCGRRFTFEGYLQRHIPSCDGIIKLRRDVEDPPKIPTEHNPDIC